MKPSKSKLTYEEYAKMRETCRPNGEKADKSKYTKVDKRSIMREESVVAETLRIARILKSNGVDLTKIPLYRTIKGKQKYILLEEIEQEGIDIQKIIRENKLDGKFKYGMRVSNLRSTYNGIRIYKITEAQKKEAEELGLILMLIDKEEKKQEATRDNQQAKELCSQYEQLLGDRSSNEHIR